MSAFTCIMMCLFIQHAECEEPMIIDMAVPDAALNHSPLSQSASNIRKRKHRDEHESQLVSGKPDNPTFYCEK